MSVPFERDNILQDMDVLYGGKIPPEEVNNIHKDGLPNLDRLADAKTLFFVIGNYADKKKLRVKRVRDKLSEPFEDEAFILEEIDPEKDKWGNFYVKFRVFLKRCQYVIGVFEDNDGGHVLEVGEANLSSVHILKRDYREASIEDDLEYEKFDGMIATLFELLDQRGQLFHWQTEEELLLSAQEFGYRLGHAKKPEV